jgi:hypothetical protein
MAAIIDLGTAYLAEPLAMSSAVVAFTSPAPYLLEVIATETHGEDANIYIFIKHVGDDEEAEPEDFYGWMAYNLPLSAYNSYQTFRFAINTGDSICVSGSGGISYHVQGIEQVV